jgi:hypothetical protein
MLMLKKVLIGCGLSLLATMTGCVALLGFLAYKMETGEVPSTAVMEGSELKSRVRSIIQNSVTLLEGEDIVFYYSGGLWNHTEDMNVITDQRVISFSEIDGNETYAEATYTEIQEIIPNFSESWWDDTTVDIYTTNNNFFSINLSPDEEGDRRVVQYMERQLNQDAQESPNDHN